MHAIIFFHCRLINTFIHFASEFSIIDYTLRLRQLFKCNNLQSLPQMLFTSRLKSLTFVAKAFFCPIIIMRLLRSTYLIMVCCRQIVVIHYPSSNLAETIMFAVVAVIVLPINTAIYISIAQQSTPD